MPVHVPYSHRHRTQPVYIGFDTPSEFRRVQRNWWGFNGLLLSIAALFTAGVMSPLAFLVCLIGLRRGPRKAAATGLFISLIGMGIIGSMVTAGVRHDMHQHHRRAMRHHNRLVAKQVEKVEGQLIIAVGELEEYRDEHDGSLPNDIDGNVFVIKHIDPWKTELRYDEGVDGAIIRSAGPDREFNTPDDLTNSISGKVDNSPLLPVNDEALTAKSSQESE